jgi:hypothetical protein
VSWKLEVGSCELEVDIWTPDVHPATSVLLLPTSNVQSPDPGSGHPLFLADFFTSNFTKSLCNAFAIIHMKNPRQFFERL